MAREIHPVVQLPNFDDCSVGTGMCTWCLSSHSCQRKSRAQFSLTRHSFLVPPVRHPCGIDRYNTGFTGDPHSSREAAGCEMRPRGISDSTGYLRVGG